MKITKEIVEILIKKESVREKNTRKNKIENENEVENKELKK